MKKRNISLILCLVLLFSALAPAALAADVETPADDPVDPAPYLYIRTIGMSFTISNGGLSHNYCRVYVPDTSYSIELTVQLERSSDGGSTWSDVSGGCWTSTGTKVVTVNNEPWYVTPGYIYRDAATIDLYTAGGLLAESVTEHSNTVSY